MRERRILAIDDDELVRRTIVKGLQRTGKYKVSTASGGKLGLKMAKRERPHVIILDITMPDMSGLDVLRELRCRATTRYTPVLMLTALTDQDSIDSANHEYAEQYLTKPFSMTKLDEAVSRAAKQYRATRHLTRPRSLSRRIHGALVRFMAG
jgi:DNA-binding response OmpR family regulator